MVTPLPELLTLLLVLAAASALRIYRIDALPPGLDVDEGVYGFFAAQVLAGDWPIFFALPTAENPVHYSVALAFGSALARSSFVSSP